MDKECKIFILIILSFVLCVLSDASYEPPLVYMNFQGYEDLMSSLFQVQATVSSIGIALLALLSGVSKQTVLGMSVSQYILEERHKIFKFKYIVLFELILVVISYFMMIFYFYNTLIMMFLLSIFFIGWISKESFCIFSGEFRLKEEIEKYYLDIFERSLSLEKKVELFNNISRDIKKSIDENIIVKCKDGIEFFQIIYETLNHMDSDQTGVIEEWEKSYINNCKAVLELGHDDAKYYVIKSIYKILAIDNSLNSLSIWDHLERDFYKNLPELDLRKVFSRSIIWGLKKNLLKNTYLDDEINKQKNNFYFYQLSASIYIGAYRNKHSGNNEFINDLKIWLYGVELFQLKEWQEELFYHDLAEYTHALIINGEKDFLDKYFVLFIEKCKDYCGTMIEDKKRIYVMSILIFLYYINSFEKLAASKLKEFVELFLSENKMLIYQFLLVFSEIFVSKKILNITRKYSRNWEIYGEGAKWIVLDSVINKFYIYYILMQANSEKQIKNNLTNMFGDGLRNFYLSFAGSRLGATKIEFAQFLKIFSGYNYEEKDINKKISLFEKITNDFYIDAEMQGMKKVDEDSADALLKKVTQDAMKEIQKKFSCFSQDFIGASYPKQLVIDHFTFWLNSKEFSEYVKDIVEEICGKEFLDKVRARVVFKKLEYNDSKILRDFFDMIDKCNCNVNVLFGYRSNFYGDSRWNDFKEFEDNAIKIKFKDSNNYVLALDRSKIGFKILNISIKIEKYTEDELLGFAKLQMDGTYSYNVVNDIFYNFEKKKLIEYLMVIRRKVIIDFEFSYKCSSENDIGVWIAFA